MAQPLRRVPAIMACVRSIVKLGDANLEFFFFTVCFSFFIFSESPFFGNFIFHENAQGWSDCSLTCSSENSIGVSKRTRKVVQDNNALGNACDGDLEQTIGCSRTLLGFFF